MPDMFDITPSPRVLRMLGQIEFKPWQCLAELIDNSVDAFLEGTRRGIALPKPEIRISLPSLSELRAGMGSIRVADNGVGMTSDALEKSVKAGYSGNDPINKLGLFGMGFNISTARLGHRTEIWTITPEASEWTGTVIDFDELEKKGKFEAPHMSRPRGIDEEHAHGTQITISKIDENRVRPLIMGRGKQLLQQKLGKIYSRLMSQIGLDLRIDDESIRPHHHCVWDISRHVETARGPVAARLEIARELPPRLYCTTCWTWLDEGETACPVCGKTDSLQSRKREIRGWLGIQRFFDQHHYGIDLIRNGRVIEELDKSLFFWENPETGDVELEYPIDTTHWGGRIVGELEIDFVKISHQKDAFDKHDPQWVLVSKEVRGEGPIRPHIAQQFGYADNDSPLARLFAGYRTGRVPGLQYLVPGNSEGKGINEEPKRWADQFWAGNPEYLTDKKWYDAVLEAEEAKKKPTTKGKREAETAAGEPPFGSESGEESGRTSAKADVRDAEEGAFEPDAVLSGTYEIREMKGAPTLKLKALKLKEGTLQNNNQIRMVIRGNEAEFQYDPNHEYFETSLDDPRGCLIRELAYQLLLRSSENQETWPLTRIEQELKRRYFKQVLLDVESISKEANDLLAELKEHLTQKLPSYAPIDQTVITSGERDDIRTKLILEGRGSEDTVSAIVEKGQFPRYLGSEFLLRAVSIWPTLVMDAQFFTVPYSTVTENRRSSALEQVAGALRDVVWLSEQASMPSLNRQQWREQLSRSASSLRLLQLWRT